MVAPIRFLSGRQQQQKIGVIGSTEDTKVLEVIGRVGIGTTIFDPSTTLDVRGSVNIRDNLTLNELEVGSGSSLGTLFVSGVSTFASDLDINASVDISNDFNVSGVSTFASNVDINASIDVDGHTKLDDLNVSGVSTFGNNVNIAGTVGIGTRIDIVPYDTLSEGTLSFEGSAGQLFSITNNLTSGSIFSVNDVSGIPSIDVDVDGTVLIAPYGSTEYVGIGTTNPTQKLDVNGTVKATLFSGSGASLTNIPNGALDNSTVSYGGVTLSLGGSDATPAFDLQDATGLPISTGVSGLGVNVATFLATPSSSNLASAVTDETGSGALVFATSPTLVTPSLGNATATTINVSGVSTFASNVDINAGLDVDGRTELDTTNISETLNVVGVSTFESNVDINASIDVDGHTELDDLNVSGVSTFASDVDINAGLDVDGRTELDTTNISETLNVVGLSTFASNVDINASIDVDGHTELDNLNVSGVSTFASDVDINADLDVDGHTELDNLNVSGVSTFIGIGTFQSDLYVGGDLYVADDLIFDEFTARNATLTGNLQVSGVSTFASNVDINASIDVDGHTELDNLNVSGVSTFASNVDVNASIDVDGHTELDDLNVSGVSTFTGSIDANGNLDVDGHTELDNLNVSGLSTFASNVDINAGLDVDGRTELDTTNISETLNVVGVSTFGSNIDINASIDVDGHTELDNLNVSGVSTFASNVDINAGLDVDGRTELDTTNISETLSVSGVSTFGSNVDINASVDIQNNLNVTGVSTFGGNVYLGDNDVLNFGAGNDLQIYHNGSDSLIRDTGTGDLYIDGGNVFIRSNLNENAISANSNGSVELYYDNDKKFETSGIGVTVYGDLYLQGGTSIGFNNDSSILYFNDATNQTRAGYWTSKDGFEIRGDGNNKSSVVLQTGNLEIDQNAYISGILGIGNTVYAATDIGIGTISPSEKLDVNGNARFRAKIFDSTNSEGLNNYVLTSNSSGNVEWKAVTSVGAISGIDITNDTTNTARYLTFATGTGNQSGLGITDSALVFNPSTTRLGIGIDNPTETLDVNGTIKTSQLNVTGVSTFGGNVYLGDNDSLYFGDSNDLRISHDGSNSVIRELGSGNLYFTSNGAGIILQKDSGNENLARFLNDGSVELYYDNSKKFETTSDGVNVTGTTDTDQLNVSGIATITTIDATNATIDNLTFTSGTAITSVDTDLSSVSATDNTLASAKAIKTYVDAQITAQDLDFAGDTGTGAVDLDSQTLTISGTANEIETSASGQTLQIGLPNDVTITQDLTVNRDVQIVRNLNVDGNITIGGTSATLFTQTLTVSDADLILGFRTDAFGNDVSNDTTANHGGIAIASTEGTPLVTIVNPGAGETLPATYKKIMWFKSGSFSGLGTDAWLSNYAIGIGSIQVPNGVRLAAGGVHITENDISKVRDINASGIITASRFVSNVSTGTAPFTVSSTTVVTNLNADTVDGIQASSFLRSDADDTLNGNLTINASGGAGLVVEAAANHLGAIFSRDLDSPDESAVVLIASDADGTDDLAFEIRGNTTGSSVDKSNTLTSPDTTFAVFGNGVTAIGYNNLGLNYSNPNSALVGVNGSADFNGTVYATTFVGNLTGTATTATNLSDAANITTGIIDSARLTGTYDIDISGNAATATYADNAGIATYATSSGIATYASTAGIATYATSSGIATYASISGVSTALQNARNFSVSGDVATSSPVSFNGTGNVDLAVTLSNNFSANTSGIITANTFSGSGASLTNIPNGALDNSTVSYGGVTLSLGGSDATPAFDLQDATGLPISTGVSGLGANVATFLATPSSSNLASAVTDETGSGALVFATSPTLVTPTLGNATATSINVSGIITANTFSGSGASLTNIPNGALDNSTVSYGGVTLSLGGSDATPAFDLQDATGLPISTGVSGLGANVATFLATPSSSNLAAAVTGETGSGALVFATSPTLVTPTLGAASATSINASGIITANTFSGSGASLTNIPNGALDNSTVSYGGVTLSLGGSDATPAFNLQDATNYPYSSLTGITTDIVGDATPQLGGDLDLNSNDITGTGNIDITGSLNVSGDVGIGVTNPTAKLDVVGTVKATDFNTTSDQNLKTNIQTIENPLDKIVQIRGVNFEWKENNKPSAGVIAQEVEKVLPELVNGEGTKTVNYNGLIGLLIEAVKAQQEEINMLKERLK